MQNVMRKPFLLLGIAAWLLLAATAWLYFAAGRGPAAEASDVAASDTLFAVEPFTLVDTAGEPVSTAAFAGRPWVAMLFLTECPSGACPMMIGRMQDLLAAVDDRRVQVVSITVNPAVDSPDRLRDYAEVIGADADRWHFLTGSPAQIAAAGDALKLVTGDEGGVGHDERFLLIDPAGDAVGVYNRRSDKEMTSLRDDARALLE